MPVHNPVDRGPVFAILGPNFANLERSDCRLPAGLGRMSVANMPHAKKSEKAAEELPLGADQ